MTASAARHDQLRRYVENIQGAGVVGARPHLIMVNFNKRALTFDLSRPSGCDLPERLMLTYDVLVENYSPRVFEKAATAGKGPPEASTSFRRS